MEAMLYFRILFFIHTKRRSCNAEQRQTQMQNTQLTTKVSIQLRHAFNIVHVLDGKFVILHFQILEIPEIGEDVVENSELVQKAQLESSTVVQESQHEHDHLLHEELDLSILTRHLWNPSKVRNTSGHCKGYLNESCLSLRRTGVLRIYLWIWIVN